MYKNRTHTIEPRIVSIHQPHVRPIVRGKSQSKVEFGSKIHLKVNSDRLKRAVLNDGIRRYLFGQFVIHFL